MRAQSVARLRRFSPDERQVSTERSLLKLSPEEIWRGGSRGRTETSQSEWTLDRLIGRSLPVIPMQPEVRMPLDSRQVRAAGRERDPSPIAYPATNWKIMTQQSILVRRPSPKPTREDSPRPPTRRSCSQREVLVLDAETLRIPFQTPKVIKITLPLNNRLIEQRVKDHKAFMEEVVHRLRRETSHGCFLLLLSGDLIDSVGEAPEDQHVLLLDVFPVSTLYKDLGSRFNVKLTPEQIRRTSQMLNGVREPSTLRLLLTNKNVFVQTLQKTPKFSPKKTKSETSPSKRSTVISPSVTYRPSDDDQDPAKLTRLLSREKVSSKFLVAKNIPQLEASASMERHLLYDLYSKYKALGGEKHGGVCFESFKEILPGMRMVPDEFARRMFAPSIQGKRIGWEAFLASVAALRGREQNDKFELLLRATCARRSDGEIDAAALHSLCLETLYKLIGTCPLVKDLADTLFRQFLEAVGEPPEATSISIDAISSAIERNSPEVDTLLLICCSQEQSLDLSLIHI
eukprot:TRINITY_DN7417_c0_g1_i1.p1 TRINITY_DN7417_c0_g1~~TRINITY_DN7417_c0_g1_i1.p1  ORF type:complete len:515 (-),score=77.19 TRINITY_DN7417_c0_g1_i1:57-1601(-)